MAKQSSSTASKALDLKRMWFIFAILAAVVVAIVTFVILQGSLAKGSYWVVTEDVSARTQITSAILEEKVVDADAVPENALNVNEVTSATYALYALQAGDILTSSNVGGLSSLYDGLPDDFVISSFTADPSSAAAGVIARGNYVDIIAVISDSSVTGSSGYTASYILQNVLVVDSSLSIDSSGGTTTDDGATVPTLYTVGLSSENAARLAIAQRYDLYVVLSPLDKDGNPIYRSDLGTTTVEGILGSAPNAGEGTDNSFSTDDKSSTGGGDASGEANSSASASESATVKESSSASESATVK